MNPYGLLNFAVLGLKDGSLQTIPFLNSLDPAGKTCCSPTMAVLTKWSHAIDCASQNRQSAGIKNHPPRAIGNKANCWFQFYGWRFVHWFEGDPMVRRSHAFCRFVRENNSGAFLRVNKGKVNYVCKKFKH